MAVCYLAGWNDSRDDVLTMSLRSSDDGRSAAAAAAVVFTDAAVRVVVVVDVKLQRWDRERRLPP